MKTQFTPTGFGMSPEALLATPNRLFRPAIAFNADDGTGGEGGTQPPPENPNPGNGEDVSGLKNALAAERKRAAEAEKQFKQLQQSFDGIDPTAAKQALDNYKKLQQQQEAWNQKETELSTRLNEEFDRKLKSASQETEGWKGRYNDLLTRTLAQQAYEAAGGRIGGDDSISFFDAFYNNVKGQLRLNEKGQLEVVDGTGARIFSKKNTNDPMQANEFFASHSEHPVFSHYFQAANSSKGGGMQPGAGNYRGNGSVRVIDRGDSVALSEPGVLEAIAKGDGSVIVR